jgi:hypothetical protein
MSYLSLYDIMTHSHFDTWHHNKISKACQANNMTRDSKSINLTHFRRLSICNLFSRNTSHSHDNLRRVSKSPLLHPFTRRRSGTLDWHVMKATSADSSRLIHTILAHSSTSLYLSIFRRHRTYTHTKRYTCIHKDIEKYASFLLLLCSSLLSIIIESECVPWYRSYVLFPLSLLPFGWRCVELDREVESHFDDFWHFSCWSERCERLKAVAPPRRWKPLIMSLALRALPSYTVSQQLFHWSNRTSECQLKRFGRQPHHWLQWPKGILS